MANDCLVTKLKGVVNNPNLAPLGTRNIQYSSYIVPSEVHTVTPEEPITIKIIGDGTFAVNGTSGLTEFTNNGTIVFTPEPAVGKNYIEINVSNWYNIDSIAGNGKPIDTDDLKYTVISEILYTSLKGKLINLLGKGITRVIMSGGNVPEDKSLIYSDDEFVATLRSWPMTHFSQIHSNGFGISAYIFGKAMPDVIENVALTDSNYGAIEDFVRGLRENRQSGTLTFNTGSFGWTFNGSNTSGEDTLSWTATTITWKGETINA